MRSGGGAERCHSTKTTASSRVVEATRRAIPISKHMAWIRILIEGPFVTPVGVGRYGHTSMTSRRHAAPKASKEWNLGPGMGLVYNTRVFTAWIAFQGHELIPRAFFCAAIVLEVGLEHESDRFAVLGGHRTVAWSIPGCSENGTKTNLSACVQPPRSRVSLA